MVDTLNIQKGILMGLICWDKPTSTKGLNIHIASAGPIQLSFKDWEEFKQVVEEAKQFLEDSGPVPWIGL